MVEYQYDALNRLRVVHFPFNPAQNIGYDYDTAVGGGYGIGRLTGVYDMSGGEQYRYDQNGRVTQKNVQIDGVDYRWYYGYDDGGSLISLEYPSGRQVNYIRDPLSKRTLSITTRDWAGAPLKTIASQFDYEAYGSRSNIIAKLTCNFCCERLCKMELRDIHKRAQQKLSGGAPCYARRHKPVTHTLGDR